MKTYIVSYDPIGPGPKHDRLAAKLGSYPESIQALSSTWFVKTDETAFKVAAAMEEILDDDDGVVVNRVTWEAAWAASIAPEIDAWLSAHLTDDDDHDDDVVEGQHDSGDPDWDQED